MGAYVLVGWRVGVGVCVCESGRVLGGVDGCMWVCVCTSMGVWVYGCWLLYTSEGVGEGDSVCRGVRVGMCGRVGAWMRSRRTVGGGGHTCESRGVGVSERAADREDLE